MPTLELDYDTKVVTIINKLVDLALEFGLDDELPNDTFTNSLDSVEKLIDIIHDSVYRDNKTGQVCTYCGGKGVRFTGLVDGADADGYSECDNPSCIKGLAK